MKQSKVSAAPKEGGLSFLLKALEGIYSIQGSTASLLGWILFFSSSAQTSRFKMKEGDMM